MIGKTDATESELLKRLIHAYHGFRHQPKHSSEASSSVPAVLSHLKSIIYAGIPMQRRDILWPLLLDVEALKVDAHPQYYITLVSQANASHCDEEWLIQIDKDLGRTFPKHPFMNSTGILSLRNILMAYAQRNASVGYCQGLNFIGAVFLMNMNEEAAFWCLAAFVERLLPGYFDTTMLVPQLDILAVNHLLEATFPSVHSHLEELGVDIGSVAGSWLLLAFLNTLPMETSLRIWDILFFEGSPVVLMQVTLALIDIYQQALLTTQDSSDVYMLLQSMGPMTFDSQKLIDTATLTYGKLTDATLRVLRAKYRPQISAKYRQQRSSSENEEHIQANWSEISPRPVDLKPHQRRTQSATAYKTYTKNSKRGQLPEFIDFKRPAVAAAMSIAAAEISVSVPHPDEEVLSPLDGESHSSLPLRRRFTDAGAELFLRNLKLDQSDWRSSIATPSQQPPATVPSLIIDMNKTIREERRREHERLAALVMRLEFEISILSAEQQAAESNAANAKREDTKLAEDLHVQITKVQGGVFDKRLLLDALKKQTSTLRDDIANLEHETYAWQDMCDSAQAMIVQHQQQLKVHDAAIKQLLEHMAALAKGEKSPVKLYTM